MRKGILLAIALLIPVVMGGCLLSGTVVFVYDLSGFARVGNQMSVTLVNLATNSDYQDNKDKLKSVDAVSVAGDLINNSASEAAAEIWISDNEYTTPAQVRANATRIFLSPTIAPHDTLALNWSDGMSHIENFSVMQDQIKGDGQFFVYGLVENQLDVEYDVDLIVTVTVGK
jgi:hypothetical protein